MAPKQRQTLLFSATFNDDVAGLVALSLKQPVRLAADAAAAAPSTLSQEVRFWLFAGLCGAVFSANTR
jgi:ATP-dependent RNA helicase DDX27